MRPIGHAVASQRTDVPLLSDYASKAEIAAIFAVSDRTIERWVRLRVLPSPIRLGRTSLYHLPSLRRHLEDRAAASSMQRRAR